MRRVEVRPHRGKRLAEIAEQLGQHLPHRLRLPRELRQVVAVVDRALAEPLPRMAECACRRGPTIVTVVAPTRATRSSPAQRHGTEYHAPSSRTSARGETVTKVVASATNGAGSAPEGRRFDGEAGPDRLAGPIAARARAAHPSARAAPD